FILIALIIDLIRRRKTLSGDEKRLWLYILGFLVIYSFPTQRQENYILPTCAALSVLIALRWDKLSKWAFRTSHVLVIIFSVLGLWFLYGIERSLKSSLFSPFAYIMLLLIVILGVLGSFRIKLGRRIFPVLVLGLFCAFSLFLKPFSTPFSEETLSRLSGQTVCFPSNFFASYEIFRFILPGADIRGYPDYRLPEDDSVRFLAVLQGIHDEIPDGYNMIDRIYHLRSRHGRGEIKDILLRGRFDFLAIRLTLLEKIDSND
ncbi:MAG: hypothetical protein JXB23_05710, partial [Candidatus Aminicenantes bacterium]|nr:hypothetical protein [Candidatus Aminicenantes bacterium]